MVGPQKRKPDMESNEWKRNISEITKTMDFGQLPMGAAPVWNAPQEGYTMTTSNYSPSTSYVASSLVSK